MRADRATLIDHYGFPLDPFQQRALDALDDGSSVLVAAPTGSGKTVVAEYAIDVAVAEGHRAFYTAPIKALSNQKYKDLVARLGSDRVGLLTGDNSINGEAPVVVMTTEVLRNMIYGRSAALANLGVVVLDEVHFLQDAYRGPVWEEVIIHLPRHVRLVCLSATVSNALELADWISTVRGPTTPVVEERRPVRLDNLYLMGDRTHDRLHLLPMFVRGHPNTQAARIDGEAARVTAGRRSPKRTAGQGRRRLYTPGRIEVVELLDDRGMLPAIVFVFSRNQCDEAARACLAAGIHLTTDEERPRIRAIADARLAALGADDLEVLGHAQFVAQLEAGVAAHHAGMVPPFKEVVEACFTEGLVKVVFATETLAVGINMPAKTVVIEKLTKFTGDHHTFLTPGEYTQLTGRAGRRGMDDHGDAVVLWSPFVGFEAVAALAGSRTFHLNSAFRPTYNMAANLVRAYTSERAHQLLSLSFAQYQADREVVRLESRLQRRQQQLATALERARSPYGDVDDYRRRRDEVRQAGHVVGRDDIVSLALMKLQPGDVIHVDKGRYSGRAAVLTNAHRKGGVRVTALTPRRHVLHLTVGDFDEPPRSLGKITMPEAFTPNRQDFQRQVAHRLDQATLQPHARRHARLEPLEDHPVEQDPDLKERMKSAAAAERLSIEVEDLRTRTKGRNQSIARDFDRVLALLATWGYVEGWSLTEAGKVLARTFHECDLLVVESLMQGLFDDLPPAQLAALVSVFVYEHRSPEPPPAPWFPNADVRRRWQRIAEISYRLEDDEQSAGLAMHRPPDPTFIAVAFAWAAGEGFAEVVEAEELTGGDFVRTTKQLIDVLRQLALVAPREDTRRSAAQAAETLHRGVVADSSAVETAADIEQDEVLAVLGDEE